MIDIFKGIAITGFGTLEGYAFARTGMLDPQVMQDQMVFKRMVIMKLFFSAVASSMLAQSAMDIFAPVKFYATREYVRANVPMRRACLGCFTLGVGMYVSGSGPTIAPSQMGTMVQSAPAILSGACFGGAIYHFLEPFLGVAKNNCRSNALDLKFGVSYSKAAIPVACALLAGVYGLERYAPHEQDMDGLLKPQGMIHPIWAGAVIGLNQIPLRWMAGRSQGGSTSVMNIISTLSGGFLAPKYRLRNIMGASQFLYVYIGTMLGAYFGYLTTHVPTGEAPPTGSSFTQSFIGAAIMLFGARYANGCTCGHGISGFSELSFTSIAAAMSIFGGGIATGVADKMLIRG